MQKILFLFHIISVCALPFQAHTKNRRSFRDRKLDMLKKRQTSSTPEREKIGKKKITFSKVIRVMSLHASGAAIIGRLQKGRFSLIRIVCEDAGAIHTKKSVCNCGFRCHGFNSCSANAIFKQQNKTSGKTIILCTSYKVTYNENLSFSVSAFADHLALNYK